MALERGDRVPIVMTKWGDRPHWEFDAWWLGSDQHGDWIGVPAGTSFDRPGAHFESTNLQVDLLPRIDLPEDERWWVAAFHGPGGNLGVSTYVDITTPPVWDRSTLRAIDLDLDVVRDLSGRVRVDDEAEFARHQVELSYPRDVTRAAILSRDRVHAAMTARAAPYDGSHERWLAILANLAALG